MNRLIITSLFAAVCGLTFTPRPAKAGDETLAAIGGFIGGVIVGSSIHDDRPSRHHDRGHSGFDRPRIVIRADLHRQGYWKWVEVRTWIPGHWIIGIDDCGRRHRTWVRGRHELRRERVWVQAPRNRRHDRDFYAYNR